MSESIQYAVLTGMIDEISQSVENDSYISAGETEDILAYIDTLERFVTAHWSQFVEFMAKDIYTDEND